jgi:hypothetical protein
MTGGNADTTSRGRLPKRREPQHPRGQRGRQEHIADCAELEMLLTRISLSQGHDLRIRRSRRLLEPWPRARIAKTKKMSQTSGSPAETPGRSNVKYH